MTGAVSRFQADSRAEWRAWLAGHHTTERSVWVVYYKKSSGRAQLTYDDIVLEALAYGWVDSTAGKVDEERTMLYLARRQPGSGWSRPNKLRVEQLRREGLLQPAGEAVIAAAVADGSWTLLDDVEDLVVPADLRAAFAAHPGAAAHWESFPRSARRGMLQWIVQAKRPETRSRRIQATAQAATEGRRAIG